MNLSAIKQVSISLGLYKSARALHRALFPSERQKFATHKALLSTFIQPGDLAFDVGANLGVRSEIMLSIGARGCRVRTAAGLRQGNARPRQQSP